MKDEGENQDTARERSVWLDERGKFKPGNKAAAGAQKPYASSLAKLRQAMMEAVTPAEFQAVIRNLLRLAKSEKAKDAIPATQLLLDRMFGKARESIELDVTTNHVQASFLSAKGLAAITDIIDAELVTPALPAPDPVVKLDVEQVPESVHYEIPSNHADESS